ncbi:50S ribosomal protein L5, chloroplastic [Dioscorea cayenensis subsp. rotundata]|uniref:Large ribosomal subunit protein uL5c n=1 Tax=Dioscorea cayennensis subsp. rotundata TaxID=55577 RepID=A0AB40C4C4_DIOCR|nr:50S ribosomal protein L5, chloroplastic [Dioscorea cayenensis subsp. rotundata]
MANTSPAFSLSPLPLSLSPPPTRCSPTLLPLRTIRVSPVLVAAPTTSTTGVVLVDRSDAEKVNRLKSVFLEKVIPILKEEFSYMNIHEVPKIEKVVVNCGMGDAEQNSKGLEAAIKDLAVITGQRPVKTRAKNSIAAFKLREGTTVGIAVTLRGNVMYSFLDRLINLGLPRTRDFQGLNPNSFDGHGNYSIGMRDQSVFPEIRYEAIGKQRGMDVCITTTAKTDKEAQRLLSLLGMPFREGGGPTVLIRRKKRKAAHFDQKGKGRR